MTFGLILFAVEKEDTGLGSERKSATRKRNAPSRAVIAHALPHQRGFITTRLRYIWCQLCPAPTNKQKADSRGLRGRNCIHVRNVCLYESGGVSDDCNVVFAPDAEDDVQEADDPDDTEVCSQFDRLDELLPQLCTDKLVYFTTRTGSRKLAQCSQQTVPHILSADYDTFSTPIRSRSGVQGFRDGAVIVNFLL